MDIDFLTFVFNKCYQNLVEVRKIGDGSKVLDKFISILLKSLLRL